MPRPTLYSEAIAGKICERLRAGCTRRAACVSAGISEDTFARWLSRYADFADSIDTSEAECEVRNTAIIEQAAFGFDATRSTRTVKTVVKPRKVRFTEGGTLETRHPDGTVTKIFYPRGTILEEPIALEETSEQTTVERQYDWHAALEVLKRRFRLAWGDRAEIDWKKLTSEQIIEILVRSVPPDEHGTESAGASSRKRTR
jgi:hypothetical protein